jgi:hypothetical protein
MQREVEKKIGNEDEWEIRLGGWLLEEETADFRLKARSDILGKIHDSR